MGRGSVAWLMVSRRFHRQDGQPPTVLRRRGRSSHRIGRGRLDDDGAGRGGLRIERQARDATQGAPLMEIKERYFEDFEIGENRRTLGRTITEADIVAHAGQTGDFFPHHLDAVWCATQDFKRRMAHGTLVFSVGVGMTASAINPRAMSYGYDRLRFIKPVFIGDTIRAARATASSSNCSKSQTRWAKPC